VGGIRDNSIFIRNRDIQTASPAASGMAEMPSPFLVISKDPSLPMCHTYDTTMGGGVFIQME
jgi:hypothetical protein